VNSHSKRLGGKLSFLQGLLVTLFRYKNKNIQMTIDAGEPLELRASSIVVANGQYFGGGMWVAPKADLNDGMFDVVVVGDVSQREVLANTSRLYRGTLAAHPKVTTYQARTIELDSAEEVLIDLDGELVGRLPARFQMGSQKIPVLF
jgi:diacylglycerol kinase (ATP)